jgi:signal transduction histidine kinase
VEFLTLVRFSKLVADSTTSESVSSVLARTIVDRCGAYHALVFGTAAEGGFSVLASYGGCNKEQLSSLDLEGVETAADLRSAVMRLCSDHGYGFRAFPMISNTGLFGTLGVVFLESRAPSDREWSLIEGMTELTAISLNKAHQQQRLQQAYDDLRASQETLVRTEKFRALGQMSAGISHDLKNLLNPLQLFVDNLRDVADQPEEVRETAQRLDRILKRGLETVERLRNFSRLSPGDSEAAPTDLNAMVGEAIEISKPKLAACALTVEQGLAPKVLLRPADCVTAIVNLIFNAVDAVEGKGRITIRTGASDGGSWLEIADDGPGIPPEIQSRILEPFFTTKGNHGTGLGVSIVYAFTQNHGGRLEIESEPGKGARFRMWFPAIDEA